MLEWERAWGCFLAVFQHIHSGHRTRSGSRPRFPELIRVNLFSIPCWDESKSWDRVRKLRHEIDRRKGGIRHPWRKRRAGGVWNFDHRSAKAGTTSQATGPWHRSSSRNLTAIATFGHEHLNIFLARLWPLLHPWYDKGIQGNKSGNYPKSNHSTASPSLINEPDCPTNAAEGTRTPL